MGEVIDFPLHVNAQARKSEIQENDPYYLFTAC